MDKEDVRSFCDPNKQKEWLRELLLETEDDQIENVYEKHLAASQAMIFELGLKHDEDLPQDLMRERHNTEDQMDKQDILAFWEQRKWLNEFLLETDDNHKEQREASQGMIDKLGLKLDKDLLNKMMSTPRVQRERSNTLDQTAPRSQAPKKNQKHRRNASGSGLHR